MSSGSGYRGYWKKYSERKHPLHKQKTRKPANTATSVLYAKDEKVEVSDSTFDMKKRSYFPISPILKEITASPFCNLPINIVVEKAGRGTVSVVSERIWLYTSTPDKL